ncbi:hypothetical protein ACHAXR_012964 [Thalassiosira sp. AJA248-18]
MAPKVLSSLKSSVRIMESGSIGGSQANSCQKQQRPPKTLTQLVAKRSWFELENILSSGSSSQQIEIDEKGVITEESILQFALRYRAPIHIIKLFALRYPLCLTKPDPTGKFACHVAAKYGSMPNVIEYLVCKNKSAAAVQDPLGKAPIHYVAEFYASNNISCTEKALNENMLQVIRIFREAAPQTFNLEDNSGCNAIEYAIENDSDIKIIKTMQRTARDDWRALKASGHGKKHEELAKDIERSACEARKNVELNGLCSARRPANTRSVSEKILKRSFVAKSA